jgi:hypothetical protein
MKSLRGWGGREREMQREGVVEKKKWGVLF